MLAITLSSCGQPLPAPSPTPSPTFGPIGLENAAYLQEVQRFGKGTLSGLAWSPDGEILAAAGALGVYLYDPQSGQELAFLETSAAAVQVVFNPDGAHIAVAQSDGLVSLWQVDWLPPAPTQTAAQPALQTASQTATSTAALQAVVQVLHIWEAHRGPVQALAVNPDGSLLATGGSDWIVRLWDSSSGRLQQEFPVPPVAGLAFNPQGDALAVALLERSTLSLLSLPEGETLFETTAPGAACRTLHFTPDGSRLLSCGSAQGAILNAATLWNVPEGTPAQRLGKVEARHRSAAISPDGSWLATGDQAGGVAIWARQPDGDYEQIDSFKAHPVRVTTLAFSPGGTRLASLSSDGQLRLWNAATGQLAAEITGHGAPLLTAALDPAGELLATAGQESQVSLWSLSSGAVERQIPGVSTSHLAFSPDGSRLAVGSPAQVGSLSLVDPQTGEVTASLEGAPSDFSSIAFYPQGRRLLLAGPAASAVIQSWDYEQGGMSRLNLPAFPHPRLAFDLSGRAVLIAARGQPLQVWDMRSTIPLVMLDPINYDVRSLAFSPDGFTAALGGAAGGEVWDLRTRRLAYRLDSLGEAVDALAFSPDGRLLVSGSAEVDGSAGEQGLDLWALPECRLIASLPLPHGRLSFAAFTADGQSLVTAGMDGVVRIYRLVAQPGPTRTVRPTITSTPTLTHTPAPTTTPTPTLTPTLTPVPTATPTHAFTRQDTALPALEPVTADNASRLVPLARWGRGAVRLAQYSPDGSRFAVVTSEGVYFYDPLSYEMESFTQIPVADHPIALSPDLSRLALNPSGNRLELWDTASGRRLLQIEAEISGMTELGSWVFLGNNRLLFTPYLSNIGHALQSMLWNLDENRIEETDLPGADWAEYRTSTNGVGVAVKKGDEVQFWETSVTTPEITRFSIPIDVSDFVLSADGALVAIGSYWESYVWVYRTSDGSLVYTSAPDTGGHGKGRGAARPQQRSGPGNFIVESLAFSPDNRRLAVVTGFGELYQIDLETGRRLTSGLTSAYELLYAPDGNQLAAIDGSVEFMNVDSGLPLARLGNHFADITDLAFQPDGHLLALATGKGRVWLRDAANGSAVNSFYKQKRSPEDAPAFGSDTINNLRFSTDGQRIYFGSYDGTIWMWDLQQGARLLSQSPHDTYVNDFSPDFRSAIYSAYNYGPVLVDFETGVHTMMGEWGGGAAFSPDGSLIALIFRGLKIFQWTPSGYTEKFDFETSNYGYFDAAYSPDGSQAVFIGYDGAIMRVNPMDGTILHEYSVGDNISSLCYSRDGSRLAVGTDETISLFASQEGLPRRVIVHKSDTIRSMVFSPDGDLLTAAFYDGLYVWDVSTGAQVAFLPGDFSTLEFSENSTSLAAGGSDGVVTIFGVPQQP